MASSPARTTITHTTITRMAITRHLAMPLALMAGCLSASLGTSISASASFFDDRSALIATNPARLSYGVAVTDIDGDGDPEFIVTGFGYANLALGLKDGKLVNQLSDPLFADARRKTIGVAACDVDGDGDEEIYFLNTDTYSGEKVLADRLLDIAPAPADLFETGDNWVAKNLTAGRSVTCVDRAGDGRYSIYVSNYGGPSRFYELKGGATNPEIVDLSTPLGLDQTTGGRAVVSGHILGPRNDIFAANERGANFLYQNIDGNFLDRAIELGVDDTMQNGRGTALADIMYDGRLGIIVGNWNGFHRMFVPTEHSFTDIATPEFRSPSMIRTVISADFDNDGYDEIFLNNIGQPNAMFRLRDGGVLEPIALSAALEATGLGTGAAVADIDNDGILDLLIAHGESAPQPLSLFRADIEGPGRYLRVAPLTSNGAPARGATVILQTDQRQHAKTIDAGSGYLCQMEPVAHYGLREGERITSITIRWTDGSTVTQTVETENTTLVVRKAE